MLNRKKAWRSLQPPRVRSLSQRQQRVQGPVRIAQAEKQPALMGSGSGWFPALRFWAPVVGHSLPGQELTPPQAKYEPPLRARSHPSPGAKKREPEILTPNRAEAESRLGWHCFSILQPWEVSSLQRGQRRSAQRPRAQSPLVLRSVEPGEPAGLRAASSDSIASMKRLEWSKAAAKISSV